MNLLLDSQRTQTFCKAVWTKPASWESGAPDQRIIHIRGANFFQPARIRRLGFRMGLGYFKCGSQNDIDWVTDFRLLIRDEAGWKEIAAAQGLSRPAHRNVRNNESNDEETIWYELQSSDIIAEAVMIEIRRCGIDDWWTPWNLAMTGIVLEGDMGEPAIETTRRSSLKLAGVDLNGLPKGISARRTDTEVRFTTRYLEVGFRLDRPAFSNLAIDDDGKGNTSNNLLVMEENPIPWNHSSAGSAQGLNRFAAQGFQLRTAEFQDVNGIPGEWAGETEVAGNIVTYEFRVLEDVTFTLQWEVLEDRLRLKAERTSERVIRAWHSSVWQFSFDSRVTPTGVLGSVTRSGETGLVRLPALIHAPRLGDLEIRTASGSGLLRSDSARPILATTAELKVGEEPQPEGDYLLLAGKHSAIFECKIGRPSAIISHIPQENMPTIVKEALSKAVLTSLPYRPDMATFANNNNAMPAPICMDNWSALTACLRDLTDGLSALDLMRDSLERWLDGGVGYASGPSPAGDHLMEDEYLMTGTSCLLGVAEYLESSEDRAWLERYGGKIRHQLDLMRARDLDKDGLIESKYRLGISGQYQWSTNFMDVISFGWKDAFSNAILYSALRIFAEVFPRLGRPDLAHSLEEWAGKLHANYLPTFYNPETGWLAGWRCKEDKLHDYGFLYVNGAAVCGGLVNDSLSGEMIRKLWEELGKTGLKEYHLGLPGNVWCIPDSDMATYQHNQSYGYYANGGLSLTQARHFVNALFKVGMMEEGDRVLQGICRSLSDGTAYGGVGSGVDWRKWDGTPTGYEGLLCDQLGIVQTIVDRYTVYQTHKQ